MGKGIGTILLTVFIVLQAIWQNNTEADKTAENSKSRYLFIILCLVIFFINGMTGVIAKAHSISTGAVDEGSFTVIYCTFTAVMSLTILLLSCLRNRKQKAMQIRKALKVKPLVIMVLLGAAAYGGNYLQLLAADQVPASVQFPLVSGGVIVLSALVSTFCFKEDKANQQRIIAERVTAALSNALRELSERQFAITDAAKKEAEARKQAAEAAAQLNQSRIDLAAWDSAVSTDLTNVSGATALSSPGIAIPVTPVLDTTAAVDLSNQLESIITAATETIGLSIGTLIGDLTTGGDAWNNFANTAISAFGDMAISVGKLAISTGVATLGIKAALASLNGYVAIAAGVALVALGSAVKTGLTNIANGGYSASTNVASAGSYSSSNIVNTTFDQESFDIRVTGELRASGNQLVAVIEREQLRKNHTT